MRAYILSIGSELTQGHLTDTNATFLAQELVAQGIELLHVVQVPDDLPRLERTLRNALVEADLVVCTGGVGPTDDDLTREAIAALCGETPKVEPALLETVRAFFGRRGLEMPERNAKQAWLIPSAEALPNPVGTAPGWFVRIGKGIVVAMPGVPREMHRMWREQALPRLLPMLPRRVFRTVNIRTLGIGESAVSQLLDELTQRAHPYVGTYAKDDGVHVRVTAAGATAAEAEAALAEALAQVRDRLGGVAYAEDERSLPAVLIGRLREAGQTLGVVEVGSGGRFGSLLFSEPDAADVVLGLRVEGISSGDVGDDGGNTGPKAGRTDAAGRADAAAEAALAEFGATLGLGVVADTAPVEQGLFEGEIVVALAGSRNASERFPLRAAYAEIQRRSALHAADVLRRALADG